MYAKVMRVQRLLVDRTSCRPTREPDVEVSMRFDNIICNWRVSIPVMLDIVVITATCMANRFVSYGRPFMIFPRVDSSYHVWTNVKVVKRGMV